jgi:hypothetical protein
MFQTTGYLLSRPCVGQRVYVRQTLPWQLGGGGGVRVLYECAGVRIAMVCITCNVACHSHGYRVCSYSGSKTGISIRSPDSSVSKTAMLPTGTHNKHPDKVAGAWSWTLSPLSAQTRNAWSYASILFRLHNMVLVLSTRTASALAYNYHIVERHVTLCLSTSPLFIVVSSNLWHRVVWYVAINGPTMTHFLHYHGTRILVAIYSSEMLLPAKQTARRHKPSGYKHIHYRRHLIQTLKVCMTSVTLSNVPEWRLQ